MPPVSAKLRPRIAIFTNDDHVWFFPAWKAALPRLVDRYEVVGIALFRSGPRAGQHRALRFFLTTFGLTNFLMLSTYAARSYLEQWFSPPRTWKALGAHYSLEVKRARSPNEGFLAEWVRANEIDVILISVDQILRSDILAAPRVGIINKHAAMLPSCRGVYPYLWARLKGIPTGVTFHQVDNGIDTGRILIQRAHPTPKHQPLSMLRFFMDIYSLFPLMLPHAVDALINQHFVSPDPALAESYETYPVRRDVKEFEKVERVARFSDLLYRPKTGASIRPQS